MDIQKRLKELAAMDYGSSDEVRKQILAAVNDDESKVVSYPVPSPLDKPDGARVKTPSEWVLERRHAILKMFRDAMEKTAQGKRIGRTEGIRSDRIEYA